MSIDAGTCVIVAVSGIEEHLRHADRALEAGEPDALHQLRVGVRRLRSTLGAFHTVFAPGTVDSLRDQYRAFGRALGEVRDREVRADHAEHLIGKVGAIDDAVRVRLVDVEHAAHDEALRALLPRLGDAAATRRREELDTLLAAPVFSEAGRQAASDILGAALRHEAKRALKAAKAADGDELESLHRARKAGRRLRYAAEALSSEPVLLFGDRVRNLAESGEEIHDLLGDHRDGILFADHVGEVAEAAARAGEDGEAYERLASAATDLAAARLAELEDAVARVRSARKALRSI